MSAHLSLVPRVAAAGSIVVAGLATSTAFLASSLTLPLLSTASTASSQTIDLSVHALQVSPTIYDRSHNDVTAAVLPAAPPPPGRSPPPPPPPSPYNTVSPPYVPPPAPPPYVPPPPPPPPPSPAGYDGPSMMPEPEPEEEGAGLYKVQLAKVGQVAVPVLIVLVLLVVLKKLCCGKKEKVGFDSGTPGEGAPASQTDYSGWN